MLRMGNNTIGHFAIIIKIIICDLFCLLLICPKTPDLFRSLFIFIEFIFIKLVPV